MSFKFFTLLISSPLFTNQLEAITNIAKSIPAEYKLYVKEHPTMELLGWRTIEYYKSINDLPNVELVHPSVKSDEMFKKSSLTITIAGTAGLEAAFYGKPSITFIKTSYSYLPFVYELDSIEELPNAIRTSLERKVDPSLLHQFIKNIEKETFQIDVSGLITDFNNKFYYGGIIVNVDLPLSKMKSFLKEHQSEFEKIASEHVKKIKQYKELETH